MSTFLELLAERILVCDGATGTELHAAGYSLDRAIPALNLTNPHLVSAVHQSYVDAGADVLQTNTFGASRLRLGLFDFEHQVAEINATGVELARQVARQASREVLVAGSVSPAVTTQQRHLASSAERSWALREQVLALTEAGVDLLILETFGYLSELVEAVTVAAALGPVPIVAQATFGPDGRTLSGHSPLELARAMSELPIAVLGVNCTLGPQGTLEVLRELAKHTDLPLSAQPNAGLPRQVSAERLEYHVAPEYFARYAARLVAAGAALIGGCCGTTPLHIAAMVTTRDLAAAPPSRRVSAVVAVPPETIAASDPAGWLEQPGPVLAAEFVPSPGDSAETVLGAAERLKQLGTQLFSIAAMPYPGPGQGVPNRSVDLSALLQDRLGSPTIATVTTWNRTIMALQAHLLGAQARGVTHIVCETGNPPLVGDYPAADGTWEVDAVGLIELLSHLNGGFDHNGLSIAGGPAFSIGARINPSAHDLALECARTQRLIAAGAQFLITRPVYESSGLINLLDAIDHALPVLVTLRPLRSFEEAEYLRYEVPDVSIPAAIMDTMERAQDEGARAGAQIVTELAAEIGPLARGLMLRCNFKNADVVDELMRAWGQTRPTA